MSVSVLPTPASVRSLEWQADGEYLADPVGAFRRWRVRDGTPVREMGVSYGRIVDSVTVSPSGRYRVLYARRGTKAVVLEGRTVLREVNRSFAHAEDYDYPVALGRLPDGREVLAHCPDACGRIRIEEPATGAVLADQPDSGNTYFHSRLAFSPDGRHLLVNGWYWRPEATVELHDVAAAIDDPRTLDGNLLRDEACGGAWRGEVVSACWIDADRIAVLETVSPDEDEDEDEDDGSGDGSGGDGDGGGADGSDTLAVLGVDGSRLSGRRVGLTPGLLVPCGSLLMNLHTHPRLLDPADGRILAEWPGLDAGDTGLCYGVQPSRHPVYAYHAPSGRFALAQRDHIAVFEVPTH